jgi:hypothetical protein
VPLFLAFGLLMNTNYSLAFSRAVPEVERHVLHLARFEDQEGTVPVLMPASLSLEEPYKRPLGESGEINTASMTRRDSLLRGMGLALGVLPTPASAFFDYEGEKTGYTYQTPSPSPGTPPASPDGAKTSSPENLEVPEDTHSAEAQLSSTDEPSPGLRDSYLLQPTMDRRTKDYQRLEKSEDESIQTLEADHYDGIYF